MNSEKNQSAQLKYETVLQKVLSENRWWIYTYSTYIDIVSEAIWVAAPITRLEVAASVSELWWAVRHKPLINEQTELKETCNIYQRFILFSLSTLSFALFFLFAGTVTVQRLGKTAVERARGNSKIENTKYCGIFKINPLLPKMIY